jgi:hypothetical protein
MCVQSVEATFPLIDESRKLTSEGDFLILSMAHQVRAILNQKEWRCFIDSRILKYEVILLERNDLILTSDDCLDPDEFLGQYSSPVELDRIPDQSDTRPTRD